MKDRPIIYASDIINSHILTLRALLTDALNLANTACDHMRHNERSAAVGTIVPIGAILSSVTAIHTVILLTHRQRS